MITVKVHGNFKRTEGFFNRVSEKRYLKILNKYGEQGVKALAEATPKDTGKTAASWVYEIVDGNGYTSIVWKNTNKNKGVPIAVILQYGHGTRNGGYVKGIDYINPAMRPIFDQIAENAWLEVINS